MVGEYLKLDRISLYDYDSETGYSALNTEWSAKGIKMEYVFNVEEYPQLMEELNYCDTFFSGGGFAEIGKTGIKSFVVSQLSADGRFTGLIFYETITRERIWSNADKKLLRNISQIVSTMLIRCNMDAAIREQNDNGADTAPYFVSITAHLAALISAEFPKIQHIFCRVPFPIYRQPAWGAPNLNARPESVRECGSRHF